MKKIFKFKSLSLLAFLVGLIWWVTGWICIDWVLNYSVYHGMTELWLYQIPFTSIEVVSSPWQAYFMSFLQIHGALVLMVYGLYGLREKLA